MRDADSTAKPRGLALMLGWQRLRLTIGVAALFGFVLSPAWSNAPLWVVMTRTVIVGLIAMLAFGVPEQWPRRLPGFVARWVLQVLAVAMVAPFAAFFAYVVTTLGADPPLWQDKQRLSGMGMMMGMSLLVAPWVAMAALLRQRDSTVRSQAQAFALQRSEMERDALDAKLRLLQAQVEPHFLFNTLANVRELVVSGSPQAPALLDHLIDYLRAAVPRLHERASTLGQELQLVRAYLELMRMRMPDRLQFGVHADDAALDLRCPPMTLLTLVENAVRHGIDPGEEGGRIDIRVTLQDGRCRVQVRDSGVGFGHGGSGLGTGLSTLRERLQLAFRGDAALILNRVEPHGVLAELDFPADRSPR